jgi:exopolysaccharide biosynthesis WecB/TagA/CpsF family protein
MSTTDTHTAPGQWPRVLLAGLPTDLLDSAGALEIITSYASCELPAQLAVVSANLDHVHHFRGDTSWQSKPPATHPLRTQTTITPAPELHWLTLLDGAPLVHKAEQLTGEPWPRLSGSDLIHPLLELAADHGWRVGFLGGTSDCHRQLKAALAKDMPTLVISGCWAPERSILADADASAILAADVAATCTNILIVGLGKPRQENWIETYGTRTGAKVLLAFGAVVDFLAGRIQRAPRWAADNGMEWAWRLSLEPRRMARRYLVQGPPAYIHLQRESAPLERPSVPRPLPIHRSVNSSLNNFKGSKGFADVSVIVVTHNNGQDVSELVGSLRSQTRDQSVRVIVCDNESTDDTVETLQKEKDIHLVRANGNLGYSGGINTAYQHVGQCASILVLNPDLTVRPNAVSAMLARLRTPGVGVVAPRILGAEGKVYPSLRREPTILRALGDAVLGRRLSARPRWLSEMDHAAQSYTLAHKIDWATGAALLIRREVADSIGNWNETFFLYSEEIDYCRRIREAGYQIWFEPDAEVQHKGAGSGTSPALATLMSVNRVRYAELHHTRYYAGVYRSTVALAEAVRSYDRYHRNTLSFVVNRKRWVELPQLAKSQPT